MDVQPVACDLRLVAGTEADPQAPADLFIEIPHGATRAADYQAVRSHLRGAIPDDLIDFFFVNTDAGAPELGLAVARRLVAAQPWRKVRLLLARVPRTFIDFNRVLDQSPEHYRAGGVTPGIPPWIRDPQDQALLRGLHAAYAEAAARGFEETCGAGGLALLLHSYAPRSVDVQVTDSIVADLHRAYLPEIVETWPLRPQVDLIARDPDGHLRASQRLVDAVIACFARADLDVTVGATYPLHPATAGYHLAQRWPERSLCVEVRRDLLADPFTPFAEMHISEVKATRVAGALVEAMLSSFYA